MGSQLSSKNIGRLMLGFGVGLLLLAAAGLLLASQQPATTAAAPTQPPTRAAATVQPSPGGAVARALPMLATQTPSPTLTPTPTRTPLPTATQRATATQPPATVVQATNAPIVWTAEEKNALSWLCYGEISGMGNSEYDACLSVISTVRARYAYTNGFTETDVIGTLRRPNQFNVPIETAQPAPEPRFMAYVEDYAQGARGSCNGYLYFNSIPGGPSACVIYGAAGLFIQFHNTF